MWESIRYVGTPIALVAFVVAVAATVLLARLRSTRQLIETAPGEQRAELVAGVLEAQRIPVENLTKEQRYNLVMRRIDAKAAAFRLVAICSVLLATIVALTVVLVSMFAVGKPAGPSQPAAPVQSVAAGSASAVGTAKAASSERGGKVFVGDKKKPAAYALVQAKESECATHTDLSGAFRFSSCELAPGARVEITLEGRSKACSGDFALGHSGEESIIILPSSCGDSVKPAPKPRHCQLDEQSHDEWTGRCQQPKRRTLAGDELASWKQSHPACDAITLFSCS